MYAHTLQLRAASREYYSSVQTPLTVQQRAHLQMAFAAFAAASRAAGVSDQSMAEWLLGVGGRWLVAHGVSAINVHTWLDQQLGRRLPAPLAAAAAARNDFGGDRR